MELAERLLELERSFWRSAGDRDAYANGLAHDAVHVLPGFGVAGRNAVLEGVEHAEPWESATIDDAHVIRLGNESAAVIYTARARRPGQPPYHAAITSVYRRTGEGWELVVHQQTPFDDPVDSSA